MRSRGIIRALLAAGLSVRRINPNKLRQFARARGVLAKNDRLDARLIAEYVAIMPTRVVQRDAAVERLAEIVTMRRQLCDEHVAAENQAAHLEDAMLRRLSKRRQTRLEADIRLLDKRLAEMVAANVALAQRYELLTSMPGVARLTIVGCCNSGDLLPPSPTHPRPARRARTLSPRAIKTWPLPRLITSPRIASLAAKNCRRPMHRLKAG